MFGFLKRKKKKSKEVKEAPKAVEKAPVKEAPVAKEEAPKEVAPQVKEETPKAPKKRKAAMHITKHKDGGWQVKKEGAQRALRLFDTQKEAIEYAKQIEKEKGTGYIIHKASGGVRKKNY